MEKKYDYYFSKETYEKQIAGSVFTREATDGVPLQSVKMRGIEVSFTDRVEKET